MAFLTADDPELVAIWNRQPVDLKSSEARYWPFCNEGGSTRIFNVAVVGTPATGCDGHNVNVPGRTCVDCGRGMIAGVAPETALATVRQVIPRKRGTRLRFISFRFKISCGCPRIGWIAGRASRR